MSRRTLISLAILSAFSLGVYLLASHLTYRLGFPLDDAWIHQTYARNLTQSGEWAFQLGQPSGGSTAPLWSGMLALGHVLGLGPYLWTYLLGWGMLWALAVVGGHAFRVLCPQRERWSFWVSVLLALEWHLVWAAGSGMETLLFVLLVVLALTWLAAGWERWLALGMLIGLSVWVRPDGLTLMGPAVVTLLSQRLAGKPKISALFSLGLGFSLLFGVYLLFTRSVAGAWWPNTFYAKQAEYAVLQQIPFWERFLSQLKLPLIGVGVALLPGFGFFIWRSLRSQAWAALAGVGWFVGYLGMYAWRLPVTYQHGRYVIPAMPVLFVFGMAGLASAVKPDAPRLWIRVFSKAWIFSVGGVLFFFWVLGARAYVQDVAVIESEMVAAARWVALNTEPNALIAAHDIGALGYFGERQLLDLAGLVSPDVIPFLRDEAHLAVYLAEQGAAYLFTFPDWYPSLAVLGDPVYRTEGEFSPALGGENIVVYRWNAP